MIKHVPYIMIKCAFEEIYGITHDTGLTDSKKLNRIMRIVNAIDQYLKKAAEHMDKPSP